MENLYDYIFWHNHHEDLWYAITRDTQLQFFNGHKDDSVYFKSKKVETLIELLTKTSLKKKFVDPATKKAVKK